MCSAAFHSSSVSDLRLYSAITLLITILMDQSAPRRPKAHVSSHFSPQLHCYVFISLPIFPIHTCYLSMISCLFLIGWFLPPTIYEQNAHWMCVCRKHCNLNIKSRCCLPISYTLYTQKFFLSGIKVHRNAKAMQVYFLAIRLNSKTCGPLATAH